MVDTGVVLGRVNNVDRSGFYKSQRVCHRSGLQYRKKTRHMSGLNECQQRDMGSVYTWVRQKRIHRSGMQSSEKVHIGLI